MKALEEFSEMGLLALRLCEDILELLPELPEKAELFADSIENKVRSIQKWAEIDAVTSPQVQTLQRMKTGVERWL